MTDEGNNGDSAAAGHVSVLQVIKFAPAASKFTCELV